MTYPTLEPGFTDRLVERLEALLPGLAVESVFEFGSTTRGEATPSSDIDLWVLVSSRERVYIDKALSASKYGPRLAEYLGGDTRQPMEDDTWQVISPQLELPDHVHLSCPIADTRWFLWELAGETRPSLALLYGERDRIVLTATSEGGLISSALSSLYGFGGLMGMQQSLLQMVEDQAESHGHAYQK